MNRLLIFSLVGLVIFATFLTHCTPQKEPGAVEFKKARAIWPIDQQFQKNVTIGFQSDFEKPDKPDKDDTFLRICGSSLYRIYLNNEFIGHGPARAGHGYYRVDEWDLDEYIVEGTNILSIEVVAYNVNSFYLLDQPSFVQAEIVSGKNILAATHPENNDFVAFTLPERVQKVPRYSFQRPFIEYYRISHEAYGLRLENKAELVLEDVGPKKLIPRRIPYPEFAIVNPKSLVAKGTVKTGIKREQYWRDRAVVNIGPKLGGFTEDELEYNPAIELQEMENEAISLQSSVFKKDSSRINLQSGEFQIVDLGTNLSGFIGLELKVHEPTRLFAVFDEILQNGDVNFRRLGTIAAVTYDLQPGFYKLESIEPYTFRYLKFIISDGSCTIDHVYLREYANPDIKRASFSSSNEKLNRIYDAGVETFRQNAVDIFMDCPHRERAGWLCDSYFTARVANDISGNTLIEKNFLENFLLPDSFSHLPDGMLPMCYPADHNDSVFIPNWAMWFVVELEEYLDRSQDRQLVDELEPKVMALLDYFMPFKNEDGLLESLDSWIFVEWSAANGFVQDVNYPTNMLFAKTLEVAGSLYGKSELTKEAEQIRKTIRKQSWNGEFFVDNAIRLNSGDPELSLETHCTPTENSTEVCQYYAFFFDIASPESHPELWRKLSTEFGPKRQESGLYPEIHPANSFIGNYLRLELLSRYNLKTQIIEESVDFFDYMAKETGTLWENIGTYASCNHGFASHVVHVLYRDILGIEKIDTKNSLIRFQFSELPLTKCKGQVPIGDDILTLEWEKIGNELHIQYSLPSAYKLEITNNTKLKLTEL